mmetsp:Transcript_30588/g.89379  ORF Transcript_30588/g.89379 Transcript_30588/m.89379 type:complete len:216 (-) Transcript_30588:43-690(-)
MHRGKAQHRIANPPLSNQFQGINSTLFLYSIKQIEELLVGDSPITQDVHLVDNVINIFERKFFAQYFNEVLCRDESRIVAVEPVECLCNLFFVDGAVRLDGCCEELRVSNLSRSIDVAAEEHTFQFVVVVAIWFKTSLEFLKGDDTGLLYIVLLKGVTEETNFLRGGTMSDDHESKLLQLAVITKVLNGSLNVVHHIHIQHFLLLLRSLRQPITS